jgi:5-methylcytosine-specific restriction endonuclease McrA
MKRCPKCEASKPLAEFNKNPSTKDGLQRYCAECYKVVKRDYYARHKERLLQGMAEKYKEDPDLYNGRTSDYYRRNRDCIAQRHAAWRQSNPGAMAAYSANRKALEISAGGSYTTKDVQRLLVLQKKHCACCGQRLRKFHVDHIQPLSKGGTNGPENLQLLCPSCNLSKSAKDPLAFMRSRGFLL